MKDQLTVILISEFILAVVYDTFSTVEESSKSCCCNGSIALGASLYIALHSVDIESPATGLRSEVHRKRYLGSWGFRDYIGVLSRPTCLAPMLFGILDVLDVLVKMFLSVLCNLCAALMCPSLGISNIYRRLYMILLWIGIKFSIESIMVKQKCCCNFFL